MKRTKNRWLKGIGVVILLLAAIALWILKHPSSSKSPIVQTETISSDNIQATKPRSENFGIDLLFGNPLKPVFRWKLGESDDIDKHQREIVKRTYLLRNARGTELHNELAAIVGDLKELATILDATPEPMVAINVMPPVPDRNPGSLPMVAGMSPAAIRDPVARKAYEDALTANAKKDQLAEWLHNTAGYHHTMITRLKWALDDLVSAGVITRKGADHALDQAGRMK